MKPPFNILLICAIACLVIALFAFFKCTSIWITLVGWSYFWWGLVGTVTWFTAFLLFAKWKEVV